MDVFCFFIIKELFVVHVLFFFISLFSLCNRTLYYIA
nr:MAG TPA: hypothetical protein [Caudoviricetes sp.]